MTPTSSLTILGLSLRSLVQRWPVLLTIQGLTFLLVLPIVLAFRSTLVNVFADSTVLERMFSGFDHTTYDDFMSQNQGAIRFFNRTVGPLMFVSIVLHGLLGAGLAVSMAGEGTVAEFLKATGRFMGRSFRLLLYVLILAVIVLLLWSFAIGAVWMGMTSGDRIESEYLTAAIVVAILFLIPVLILSLGSEYARILMVREDRRRVMRTLFEGLAFVFKHPVRMLVQHGSILLAMVLLIALYWLVEDVVGMTSVVGVLVMLVVQQASIFGRIAVRGWHTASAVTLVDVLTPEVPPAVAAQIAATPPPPQPIAPLPLPPAPAAITPQVRVRKAARRGVRKPAPGRRTTVRKRPKKR